MFQVRDRVRKAQGDLPPPAFSPCPSSSRPTGTERATQTSKMPGCRLDPPFPDVVAMQRTAGCHGQRPRLVCPVVSIMPVFPP